MAPKKNKSKVEEESVANMSIGWYKSKMSEAVVQELENLGLLQAQGVIQWRAGEGEDYPMEGTLETVVFRDFLERGLAFPVSEFFLWSFAVLGNPTAPSNSSIQSSSFYFYPFLRSIPWHSSPLSPFPTLFHSYSRSDLCQTCGCQGL